MVVFDYWGSIQGLTAGNLFCFIPSYRIGPVFLVLSLLAAIIFLVLSRKNSGSCSTFWSLGLPSLFFLSAYLMTYGIIDEVAINLEHSYNLFHYAKFSMAPDRMVDGTVELLYYLAHTPWAINHQTLILGNFLIGLAVGWLHLWLLWKFWFQARTVRDVLALCLFGLNLSLMETFSSGFGNGLLSLVFLAALSAYHQGKPRFFLAGLVFLPLIRPDGILVSMAGALFIAIDPKKQFSKKLKPFMTATAGALVVLGLYFLLIKMMYGHFVPTPLYLKSVSPGMRQLFDLRGFALHIGYWIVKPWTAVFLLFIGYQILRRKLFQETAPVFRALLIFGLFLLPSFFYVEISNNIISVLRMDFTYSRYWGSLLLVIYMAAALTARNFRISSKRIPHPNRPFLMIFLVVLYTGFSIYELKQIKQRHAGGYLNRTYAAAAGSFMDRVAPAKMTFATAEMNTFGLSSERFVTDLFGYSTPEIARSKQISFEGMRTNPGYFHELGPDVVWLYWFSHKHLFANFGDPYDVLEEALKVHACGYYHGDYRRTFREYDFFLIRDAAAGFQSGYLIRKTATKSLADALKQNGFVLTRSRQTPDEFYKDFGCPYPVTFA